MTIVEGLANLDQLRHSQVEFVAIPLRIRGGDGCPFGRSPANWTSEKEMSVLLGCIADDYTGATDLANMLVRQGCAQRCGSTPHS